MAMPCVAAGHLVLDTGLLGGPLTAQVSLLASAAVTNLAALTPAALAASVLPAVMPPAWRGAGLVRYAEGDGDAEAPAISW